MTSLTNITRSMHRYLRVKLTLLSVGRAIILSNIYENLKFLISSHLKERLILVIFGFEFYRSGNIDIICDREEKL